MPSFDRRLAAAQPSAATGMRPSGGRQPRWRTRHRALLAVCGAAVAAVAGGTIAHLPPVQRRIWELADAVWSRRSWYDITARNRQPLNGIVHRRLSFGPHPRQYVLWFAPEAPPTRPYDLLFYVHGGGWRGGSPDYHTFLGRHFAGQGSPTILAGYRLAPEVTFRPMLEDLATGLAVGVALSQERGWQGGVTVIGQSAGGHLGALLTMGGRTLLPDAPVTEAITGLVTLGGVLDLSLLPAHEFARTAADLVGPGQDPWLADPIRYVTDRITTRVLCVHGRKDWLVDPAHARAFVERINMAGGSAELQIVPNRHHVDLLEVLYRDSPAARRLRTWLDGQRTDPSSERARPDPDREHG